MKHYKKCVDDHIYCQGALVCKVDTCFFVNNCAAAAAAVQDVSVLWNIPFVYCPRNCTSVLPSTSTVYG